MMKVINRQVVADALSKTNLPLDAQTSILELVERAGEEFAATITETIDASPPGTGYYIGMLLDQVLVSMGKRTTKVTLDALTDIIGGFDAQG